MFYFLNIFEKVNYKMSSITDKPISLKSEDLLNVEKYSTALSNFIIKSDTPITVGLQGEWGTGKTSLMSLLLEDFNSQNIACSWVNTWEYSMFRGANETTPGVLRGMLEKLKIYCEPELYVDLGSRYPNFIQDVINILIK